MSLEGERSPTTQSVSAWNIANMVTVGRILLVPIFGVLLFVDGGHNITVRLIAYAVFLIAALTDRLDGELARRRGLVTDFGKIADPIADKALIGMALIGLSVLGELWWWVTIIIIVREVGVTVLRFSVIRYGVLPASRGGKTKTVMQIVAISAYLIPIAHWFEGWTVVCVCLMLLALAITVISGIDYVVKATALIQRKND